MAETIITAILGSGGVVSIFFFFFRRWIEKVLDEHEEKRKSMHEYQVKRDELEDKKSHCYGRMFFWLYKAIVTNQHNGDLERAFEELQKVEEEIKSFDRRKLAELRND